MTKNVHVCVTESLPCAAQGHNTVNQLYFNQIHDRKGGKDGREGREGRKGGKEGRGYQGWAFTKRVVSI